MCVCARESVEDDERRCVVRCVLLFVYGNLLKLSIILSSLCLIDDDDDGGGNGGAYF